MARMLPTEAEKLLGNVPQDAAFRCHNGEMYWNLRDLGRGLASMDEYAFKHHVNESKNDFATWIRDAVGDHALARNLWDTRNPATTSRRVSERVAFLESRR